ncbi:hypothetical protein HG535_0H02500 [Zygotorulaspora mrakii]|uniref:UNC-45/Cro1/She4 central domain-containing protein n=1 Tax=Zygotorulaspora mrakii TaxID=42260 RepID=A0A7H9B8S2_ZYGMR|nr:uncharacterized protein HG535_0H02500 [Zygotorulaspora mrakii]QLG74923.1 hypothetical protein HG535_0H02500 [Zygotorulaspora mrakii]
MSLPSDIEELCSRLEKGVKVTDVEEYNSLVKDILCCDNSKELFKTVTPEKVEEVLTRAYQDYSESRSVLVNQVQSSVPRALTIFEALSPQSVYILAGCFSDVESSYKILEELKTRIHYGEDFHVKYLLNVTLQLLSKFDYSFDKIAFLVDELCERGRENEIRPLMLVVFSMLEKKFEKDFDQKFLKEMDSLVMESEADVGNDPLESIINILMELYPVLTSLCSEVFLGERLVKQFKRKVLVQDDEDFTKNLLKLFSIACIDENVRVYISEHYISLLEQSIKIKAYTVLTTLVLVKTWSFAKLQNVSINALAEILIDVIMTMDIDVCKDEELSASIEGLAYLSLKTSVKQSLRKKKRVCNQLAALAKAENMNSDSYGSLVVLGNLSVYPEDKKDGSSLEPKAMRDLKSYSDLKSPIDSNGGSNVKETKEEVLQFNTEYIVKEQVLSALCAKFGGLSHGSKQQVIRLIYNVTRDRTCIDDCIKQGCITSVLEYMVNNQSSKDIVKVYAARALAKMLIYTNPSLIFNKYSPVNAIGPLFELIPKVAPNAQDESFDSDLLTVVDTYEALLALTNLASTEGSQGEEVCKRIATNDEFWSMIENLMLDENTVLQRSTLELIGNLMSNPLPIAAKFFNFENPRSVKNFNVLVKLLDLNDLPSQRAVTAIFANIATSVPFIAVELSKQQELIDRMIDLFAEQWEDEELSHRLIIFFYAIMDELPAEDSYLSGNNRLKECLERAQKLTNRDPQVSEMLSIVLSKFKV